jgi:uncharacterized protein
MHTKIDWDENKNRINKKNHHVSFEIAQHVFDDPFAVACQDRYENGEYRWQTIGMVGGVLILLVAHTVSFEKDSEVIRIISARRAERHERRRYEEQLSYP